MTQFYLKKRGLWYRPNAAGYTANILDAGRFDQADALKRAGVVEGVTAHSEREVKAGIWAEMQTSLKRTADLAALWEKL